MEDTVIVPNHFAYSFRYDLRPTDFVSFPEDGVSTFKDLIDNIPFISYYLGKLEYAELSKKPHMQSIVWTPQKLTQRQMQVPRNRVLKLFSYDKNAGKYSFASAKKVVSLASYCLKDPSSDIITNLPEESLAKLPEWVPKLSFHRNQKHTLERLLAASVYPEMSYPQFCTTYNHLFIQVYNRPCCHRNTYFKEAHNLGVIDDETFFEFIGVIKKTNNKSCNYCSYSCENIKM